MAQPRSRQELQDIYRQEVQIHAPELTDFEEGSINDANAGAFSTAMSEVVDNILRQFKKTFINTADGPEITGGADDLETLAVDHYGDEFERPAATKAVGVVTFTRATTAAGDVLIPAGTIVKTLPNANGEAQRYTTILTVTMTGLTVNASIEAVESGTKGDQDADTVTVIESTLTDASVTVNNDDAVSGGEAEQDDAAYRQTILRLIQQLKGASKEAIEARLLNIPGVEKATVVEFAQIVIEYDPDTEVTSGEHFTIPRVKGYIADANGTANPALIASAQTAAAEVRACGVRIDIEGAVALLMNWTATITLNPSGPNFATLDDNPAMIKETMQAYIEALGIGESFNRALARAYVLAAWGPSGTNDLTDFVTSVPTGEINPADNEKLIPGTMEIT